VAEAYAESWRQGIKAVAIYRDGSKGTQPLNTSMDAKKEPSALDAVGTRVLASLAAHQPAAEADLKSLQAKVGEKLEVTAMQVIAAAEAFQKNIEEIAKAAAVPVLSASAGVAAATPREAQDPNGPPRTVRHRLQDERASITHKFSIAGHEGYVTVGLYPNGQPGEIFIKMAKEGSTVSGLMDAFGVSVSMALQHGVPLKVLCEKFAHTRFEPSGWTGNEQIGFAKSIMDYIFRWLQLRFLSGHQLSLFSGLAAGVQRPVDEPLLETTPPAGGILTETSQGGASGSVEDRGLYGAPETRRSGGAIFHAADAMKEYLDMGDAPSCHTC
jgi:ribonucleoside-diphosphate reductase alpha chain